MNTLRLSLSAFEPHRVYLDRILGGISLLVLHETGSLQGHVAAAQERLRLARRARGLGELLRDQVDLLPESRNRLRRDQQIRRELWRGLARDLSTQRPSGIKAA